MKGGWRHGVFGVEDPDSSNPSVFYKDTNESKNKAQHEKETINLNRSKSKFSSFLSYRIGPWLVDY